MTIREIYWNENLNGNLLTIPLRSYHGFFVKKITDSSTIIKLSLVVLNIVTGVFAYPTLGLVASVGILIKKIDYGYVLIHNQKQISFVQQDCNNICVVGFNIPEVPKKYNKTLSEHHFTCDNYEQEKFNKAIADQVTPYTNEGIRIKAICFGSKDLGLKIKFVV